MIHIKTTWKAKKKKKKLPLFKHKYKQYPNRQKWLCSVYYSVKNQTDIWCFKDTAVPVLREQSCWSGKTFKSASAKTLQLWENPSGPVQNNLALIDPHKKWTWLGIAS